MSLLDKASLVLTPNAYKESKLYSVIPSSGLGDMTVTRSTTATRVNEAGLIEEVPYNLLTYSEDFSNAIWIKSGASASTENFTNPRGEALSYFLKEDSTNGVHQIYTANTIVAGSINTISFLLKRKVGSADRFLRVQSTDGSFSNGARVIFDIQNMIISTSVASLGTGSNVSASIESFGADGWFKVSLTCKIDEVSTVFRNNNYLQNQGSSFTAGYQGNGTSGVYIWGAQLNTGSFAKPYFPTTDRLNIPQIDYTDGYSSLLIEPQRTNLFTYSEQFDNGTWTKYNTTVASNTTISPDGQLTADKLIENASNFNHEIAQQYNGFLIGNSYTFSFFAKAGERTFTRINSNGAGFGQQDYAVYDLSLGIVKGKGTNGTANIQNVGNGWFRCSRTITAISSGNWSMFVGLSTGLDVRGESYQGDGTSGVYLWGAQLEAGTYAISYIPTVASAVTRNSGNIGLLNFTNAPTTFGFTMYAETYIRQASQNAITLIDSTTNNKYFTIGTENTGQYNAVARPNGTEHKALGSVFIEGWHKTVGVFTENSVKLFVDGILEATTSHSELFNSNINDVLIGQLRILNDVGTRTSSKCNAIFNYTLTDTECIQLTTI